MKRLFTLMVVAFLLGQTVAWAQSIDRKFATTPTAAQQQTVKSKADKAGQIRLAPSNKFNVAPQDVPAWIMGHSANATKKGASKVGKRKIAAAANYADSLLLYGIYVVPTGFDLAPGMTDRLLYSFHAAPTLDFMAESSTAIDGATAYCIVNNKIYTFSSGAYNIYDLSGNLQETGAFQIDGEDVTPMQAATYDPLTKLIYLVYWGPDWAKWLMSFDPETHAIKAIAALTGYPMTIAASPDGYLYTINYPANLFKINKETGEMVTISSSAKVSGRPAYQNGTAALSGTFDWQTGKFYLFNMDSRWNTHLDVIDVTDGSATAIEDFNNAEHFVGLYIPVGEADAPGFPSDINFADGKLTFTAPTKTYSSGADLTGTLTAYVTLEDGTQKTAEVKPGEAATIALDLADGKHIIDLAIGNSAGKSPIRRLAAFVGQDVPVAVGDLTFTVDGTTGNLTWTAPTATMNGGPCDDATINYTVTRYPGGVVVATGLTTTSFSEGLPDARGHYYYVVTAYSGTSEGASATSNEVAYGTIWYPPYTETFDYEEDFNSFGVVDANEDAKSWSFSENLQNAYLTGNGVNDGQYQFDGYGNKDYLITPSISLKKGIDYVLTYNTGNQWMTKEHQTILLGKKQAVVGDEKEIDSRDLLSSVNEYEVIFNVEEDGLYNILFLSDAPDNSLGYTLDNICVDIYAAHAGPDSVTNLTATAGEKGALTNTVSFTTPTKTYAGETLENITKVEIFRNGDTTPAKTFENPGVGKAYTWVDTDVEQGMVSYVVRAYNEAGEGKRATVSNWVGLDEPANVVLLTTKMDEAYHATATWEKVGEVGKHGGYVNPDEVTYTLCRYNAWSWDDRWPAVTEPSSELSAVDSTYTYTDQTYVNYMVVAHNAAGSSDGTEFGIVLGVPYELPYTESYPNAAAEKDPWTLFAQSYNYAWNIVSGSGLAVKPQDGDGGMLQFALVGDDSNDQVLAGPRISLDGKESQELSFYMWHGYEAEPEDLYLIVYLNYDDEGWSEAVRVPYNNDTEGWGRYSIALADGHRDVQIAFGAYAADESAAIYVDALKIDQGNEVDMAIENILLSNKRVNVGEKATITVQTANYGTKANSDYDVILLRDGQFFASQKGSELASNSTTKYTFEINPTAYEASNYYLFSAYVSSPNDAVSSNDSSRTARLYVVGSKMPQARELTGTTYKGNVVLNWLAPETTEMADAVTDDFESYESFIIDGIGDWKTYDGDGTATAYFGGPEIANVYSPKAWQVWAPVEAGFSTETFDVLTTHSGNKYLACWAASDGYSTVLPNDDWLISPEVAGGSDVSFYYRMPNATSDPQVFEILYSTTDQEPTSFTVLERDSIVSTTDWVNFIYTLPKDAKYFAIRSCCTGSYLVAFLDDITYTPKYGSSTELTFQGYNVYRDGELIASGITELAYSDEGAGDEEHTYVVTAVWAEGESDYSNSYESLVGTGVTIEEATSTTGEATYYDLSGRRINTPRGIVIKKQGGKAVKTVVK